MMANSENVCQKSNKIGFLCHNDSKLSIILQICVCNIQFALSRDHIGRRDSPEQNCFVKLNRVGQWDPLEDSTRQNCFVVLSWVASGDVITLKTQPDSCWSNFRPVGASHRFLNISELVEASRRQSGDVITFTTRKN